MVNYSPKPNNHYENTRLHGVVTVLLDMNLSEGRIRLLSVTECCSVWDAKLTVSIEMGKRKSIKYQNVSQSLPSPNIYNPLGLFSYKKTIKKSSHSC